MAITTSAVVLLLIVVALLVKKGGLKVTHAVAAMLLGFYLASSSVAPTIRDATGSLAGFLSGIRL